jgi:hypothetical protein
MDVPFRQSLGSRRNLYKKRDLSEIGYVILHTTGNGPNDRMEAARFSRWRKRHSSITTPFEAAIWVYRSAMKAGPHYVIDGATGQCVQVARHGESAWHVGSSWKGRQATAVYKDTDWIMRGVDVRWWNEEFPGLNSPLDLGCWDKGSVNRVSIGIEVVPPKDKLPWSNECCARILEVWDQFPAAALLTHSIVHPLARSSQGRAWDPPNEQLEVLKLFQQRELLAASSALHDIGARNSRSGYLDSICSVLRSKETKEPSDLPDPLVISRRRGKGSH